MAARPRILYPFTEGLGPVVPLGRACKRVVPCRFLYVLYLQTKLHCMVFRW